ncbi:MAG: DUF5666 domain-containing protein [Candidatus Limnocylindrales bacterium]
MIHMIHEFGARRVATVVVAIGLVAVVAVPAINAASSPAGGGAPVSASSSVAGGANQVDETALTAATVRLGGGLKRIVRGDLVVQAKGGAYVNVHYERGQISAASAGSITVVGPDGKGATFALTAATRIRSDGQAIKAGDLVVGRPVLVFGTGSAGSYTAVLVREPVARAGRNAAPSPSAP